MTRVTVINDWPDFLALLEAVLTPEYEVTTLRAADSDLEEIVATRPDVVLVDVRPNEPSDLLGWEVVRAGRDHPQLRHVPIIITATDLRAVAALDEEIRAAGAVVLAKPFTLAALESTVASLVRPDKKG